MRKALVLALVVACDPSEVDTTGGGELMMEPGQSYRLAFDSRAPGPLVNHGELISILGDWRVQPDPNAPSPPQVLQQTLELSHGDFPRAVVRERIFRDHLVGTWCKIHSGAQAQSCGVMLRFSDSDNYLAVALGALRGDVRVIRVAGGAAQDLATVSAAIVRDHWHRLEVQTEGTRIQIRVDGGVVLNTEDSTLLEGKVGFWTEADSRVSFDNFEARAL